MKRKIFVALWLIGVATGQEVPEAPLSMQASISRAAISRQSWAMFAGLGGEIVADGVTTRVLYQRHYDETDPVARPFVHAGVPGQIAVSLLGAGALAGTWWMLRRSHREGMARNFLRSVAAVEGGNDVREFAILRTSRRATAPSQENSQFAEPKVKILK